MERFRENLSTTIMQEQINTLVYADKAVGPVPSPLGSSPG